METNPIGKPQIEAIENQVNALAEKWDEQQDMEKPGWWQFWKKGASLYKITKFIMDSLDELIRHIDNLVDSGPDKKATVLAAVEKLYDYVIREAMPLWLRPFSPAIKKFILEVMVAQAIDFIVAKYREGVWKDGKDETAAEM